MSLRRALWRRKRKQFKKSDYRKENRGCGYMCFICHPKLALIPFRKHKMAFTEDVENDPNFPG